jgi:peroxiredoxin
VNLRTAAPRLVLYVYPSATGLPDLPTPDWAEIPGAIGCTAESCAFRDRRESFQALGVTVMGLSAQDTQTQREFAARKEIDFPLLSDDGLILERELRLPTFTTGSLRLYRRLTLVADSGRIVKVFYPVFPPDTHPADVLEWVRGHFQRAE